MLGLNCLIFEKILFLVANLFEYLKTINPGFGPPYILRWVSIIDKRILLLLIIECLKDTESLLLISYSNIDDSLECLTLIFVLENFFREILYQLSVRYDSILPLV